MILDGKEMSNRTKEWVKGYVEYLKEKTGKAPNLAVVVVGDDPASQVYVRNKGKACQEVGITTTTVRIPEAATTQELIYEINCLNKDNGVDGILVQLPLPSHLKDDTRLILDTIDRRKDVDGFHKDNVANLWINNHHPYKGHDDDILPCTPKGILQMIKEAYGNNGTIEGKHAVVLGRSNIVGLPMAKLLLDNNATVTICHSKTENLSEITRQADILVSAIGKPKFVTEDMVKMGAIVIDVGINRDENGKLCGDVDFENVKDKAGFITPVPGGVGPMTVAELMVNTLNSFIKRK